MIPILIFTAFWLAIWHFIWEGMLLPTIRMHLRYKLFNLRDQIRNLKYEMNDDFDSKTFHEVQHYINASINLLPVISPFLLFESMRRYSDDDQFRSRIEATLHALKAIDNADIEKVLTQTTKLTLQALLYNMGGWIPYAAPFLPIILLVKYLNRSTKRLTKSISTLLSTPENELKRIRPHSDLAFGQH